MPVTAQFLICLMAQERAGDHVAELMVAESRDQTREFFYANTILWRVALSLKCEVQRDTTRPSDAHGLLSLS
jgi:hypothetical protein